MSSMLVRRSLPGFHNDNVKKIVFSIGFGIIGP